MKAAHVDLNLELLARVGAHVAATTAHQFIRLLSPVEHWLRPACPCKRKQIQYAKET